MKALHRHPSARTCEDSMAYVFCNEYSKSQILFTTRNVNGHKVLSVT